MDPVLALVELHEGRRRFPYEDTVGKLTIGVGFNLTDVGLLDEEINFILANRVGQAREALKKCLSWFDSLDPVRQAVLIDMEYNMGPEPFDGDGDKDWPIFMHQVETKQYAAAARNMRATKWYRQVKSRGERLAVMMETGRWPDGLTS